MPSLTEVLEDSSPVVALAESFATLGHELYIVGGPVRDSFLGRSFDDVDLATSAPPEETLRAVKGMRPSAVWEQGKAFGTIGAEIDGVRMEITTFRSEQYEPGSRHPRVVFEDKISADLSRRDFTINAMAVRLPDREAVDPFDGLKDLRARMIRTPIDPGLSFADDPLRMLRAFRFASQLDFKIDSETLEAIADGKELLRTVSAERIRDELSKLVTGAAPAEALKLADGTGITELFLPELPALKLEQDPVHRHKDVFHHTLAVVERTDPELELRLAALLHDIGKPRTRRITPEGVSFHHHEIEGAKMAAERLRGLRFPNETVNAVSEVIRLHHRFHTYRLGWTDSAVRRYVRDAGPLLGLLNRMVRADCTTRDPVKARRLARRMDELEERIAELAAREEIERIRPDLDGVQIMEFLGIPGGPLVGKARDHMLEVRLDEGPLPEDEAYARLAAWAREQGIQPTGRKVPPKPARKE